MLRSTMWQRLCLLGHSFKLDDDVSPGGKAPAFVVGVRCNIACANFRELQQMVLRVGINATPLRAPLTGIGNYIVELGAALAKGGEIDPFAFCGRTWRHGVPAASANASDFQVHSAMSPRARRWLPGITSFGRKLVRGVDGAAFGRGLRRHSIDVYHEPNYAPICWDVPVVVTVHDLSWMHFPDAHPRDRVRWLDECLPRVISDAAAIVVDSAYVRDELISTFGVDSSRVHTVPLGVSERFRPRSPVETRDVLDRLGLVHGQYLLTVGTLEPRKNLRHVLLAYARLPQAIRDRVPLVIAGARGWLSAELERELNALAKGGRVRFVGPVPAADLPALYSGSKLFVFASRYEGFGLPPLEAMASGVPVLVSDRGAMPEVAGGAARLLDPDRPEETTRGIEELVAESCSARNVLIERGLERASVLTWEACARATAGVYRTVVGDRGTRSQPAVAAANQPTRTEWGTH